jgi:hypothetical protein
VGDHDLIDYVVGDIKDEADAYMAKLIISHPELKEKFENFVIANSAWLMSREH